GLARLAIDDGVEEQGRARRVVVPDVVVNFLEMPGVFAGLSVQGDDGSAEEVVAFAHRAVVIRSAIADREVDEPELRIERRRVPDRRAAMQIMVSAGRPCVATYLGRRRKRIPPPQDLSGLR